MSGALRLPNALWANQRAFQKSGRGLLSALAVEPEVFLVSGSLRRQPWVLVGALEDTGQRRCLGSP